MKLPAELSASLREGATRSAMMGDKSQSKRGDVELKAFLPEDLGGDGEGPHCGGRHQVRSRNHFAKRGHFYLGLTRA